MNIRRQICEKKKGRHNYHSAVFDIYSTRQQDVTEIYDRCANKLSSLGISNSDSNIKINKLDIIPVRRRIDD